MKLGSATRGPTPVLGRLPVRFKLALVLALPSVALLLLSGATLADARQAAGTARTQSELATATGGPRGLLRNLQAERNQTTGYLMGTEDILHLPIGGLPDARAVVDEALDEFRAESRRLGGRVDDAYRPALDALDELQQLRSEVDAVPNPGNAGNFPVSSDMFVRYSELIDGLFDAGDRVAVEVDDAELRRGAEVVTLGTRQLDMTARLIRLLLLGAVKSPGEGFDEPGERRPVETLVADLGNRQDALELNATGPYRRYIDQLLGHEAVAELPELAESALENARVDLQVVLALTGSDTLGYDEMLDGVTAELADQADASTGRAVLLQRIYTVLGLLVLALVAALAWLVSRSITRPLQLLTEQAQRMAGEDLPRAVSAILEAPTGADATGVVPSPRPRVDVPSRDEVGAVAEALNIVQGAAVELAMEQALLRRNVADSFVNLGRRNHDLLARQLDFITELERHETDADALASLFRLDHLATRMRRNAESLLVLAGLDLPRQWSVPVKVVDVLRAALGEVEGYQRVALDPLGAGAVQGSVASSLAHLLAELIENALTFSSPATWVRAAGAGQPEGYVITITDEGPGLGPEALATANRRLAGAESFAAVPSEQLGHYVSGHLAARHGIHVSLESPVSPSLMSSSPASPTGAAGTRAVVRVPAALVVAVPPSAVGAPGSRPSGEPHPSR